MNIPRIGLGTRKMHGETLQKALSSALEIGYRHIDTAWIYQNEEEIGSFLQQSSIPRDQIWITTKIRFDYVPQKHHSHSFIPSDFGYTQLFSRIEDTFRALKTDYIDLVLLHRPTFIENDLRAFESLLKLKYQGRIRSVGVANFPLSQLKKLYETFGEEIATNQIEWHPLLSSLPLQHFAQEKNLPLTAYSPLGQGYILSYPQLVHFAHQLNISVAQLCIAYLLAQQAIVIPKSVHPLRLQENYEAKNLMLPIEIIQAIDALPKSYRYCNPPFAPHWDS